MKILYYVCTIVDRTFIMLYLCYTYTVHSTQYTYIKYIFCIESPYSAHLQPLRPYRHVFTFLPFFTFQIEKDKDADKEIDENKDKDKEKDKDEKKDAK